VVGVRVVSIGVGWGAAVLGVAVSGACIAGFFCRGCSCEVAQLIDAPPGATRKPPKTTNEAMTNGRTKCVLAMTNPPWFCYQHPW
jgi:hypothetical protein